VRNSLIILIALVLSVLAGCEGAAKKKEPSGGRRELLSVDFTEGQTLRYKFVSYRSIDIITKDPSGRGKENIDKNYETAEMVFSYTPLEIDPYGPTTVKATCESVITKRNSTRPVPEALRTLSGKSFTFTVSPAGKIEDYSQLKRLIRETGEKAFRPRSERGRIKWPDMIGDFIATQWFLWDSVSSVPKPAEGVSLWQSWKSKLSVPTPMIMQQARDVTYRLEDIRREDKGLIAVINSTFTAAETTPRSWPMPYPDGTFQMSGKFGFYRNYRVLGLKGSGEELYNIDAGRTEKYKHEYEMRLKASAPFGISLDLQMIVKQKLLMHLLQEQGTE